MKHLGQIALCLLLAFALPATAARTPHGRKARVHAKAPKPPAQHNQSPAPAKQAAAKKQEGDPTKSWQPYSYP